MLEVYERTTSNLRGSRHSRKRDEGSGGGTYSPMNGGLSPCTTSSSSHYRSGGEDRPLLVERPPPPPQPAPREDGDGHIGGGGSYVPPGYIILDHRTNTVEYTEYMPNSAASL